MFVAFTFIFCNPLVCDYIEFCFVLYMNLCLFNPRCLQSTHSLRFTPTAIILPLQSFLFCPLHSVPIATNKGCAVGTGYTDTIHPFGATCCHHLHDTT